VGPGNHVLDWVQIRPWKGATLRGGNGHPIVKYRDTAIICAKMAEPIEMPFGLWSWMDHRKRVLDGGPEVLRDVAMAANFGTQFAITGFVGYKFACVIDSDTLFGSRDWVFRVKLSDKDLAEFKYLRVVAMATIFGLKMLLTGFV